MIHGLSVQSSQRYDLSRLRIHGKVLCSINDVTCGERKYFSAGDWSRHTDFASYITYHHITHIAT